MFQQLASLLNAGAAGVVVTVFVSIVSYVREGIRFGKQATIHDYLEWLRRRHHEELLEGERQILTVLELGEVQSKVLQDYLSRLIGLVEEQGDKLHEILDRTARLPGMDEKLDLLLEKFSHLETGMLLKGQVAMSAKVLDVVARGISGAGAKVVMERKPDLSKVGTLNCVWLLGAKSPHMMLADYVGGIHDNRLSLILNPDGSLTMRAYDGMGKETIIRSPCYAPQDLLVAFALWEGHEVSFWVNGSKNGCATLESEFAYLGPLLLFGMDIEGQLSADAVRWAPPGQQPGLNFQKDGIWHGSRLDQMALWGRVLQDDEIALLTEDPFAMLRPPVITDGGACPNCGRPVERNATKPPDDISVPGCRSEWYVCRKCGHECVKTAPREEEQ